MSDSTPLPRQIDLTDGPVGDLLAALNDLDVNRLAGALRSAQRVSTENPGVVFYEIAAMETKVQEAIAALIEARRHLKTGIGNLIAREADSAQS